MEKVLTIYHGSKEIVKNPLCGKGNKHNDYGLGFYCTEHLELAKEWAVSPTSNGYTNKYSIDISDLKILNLNSSKYSILHWIALLLKNRNITINNDIEELSKEYILKNFALDIKEYDIIIGYRADDSYFSFARDFLSSSISVSRLKEVMKLGDLGNQIVIKSQKAFSRLKFIEAVPVDKDIYYPLRKKRDEIARNKYLSSRKGSLLEKDSLFIIDIIRGGIKENDPRL